MRLCTTLIPITMAVPSVVPGAAGEADAFKDHGVGAKVAECRGVVTTRTKDGRCLVIANALDLSPVGYVLVTDIDSGETTQHFSPANIPQSAAYASLLASSGRFYTAQGSVLLELDPETREWTFHGKPSPHASCYLWFTEGPDGVVWGGSCPTVLISFDPASRQMKDHGRLDPKEQYLSSLAVDDAGWVYGGIGTARCNIVAYDPATGEKRQLVKEEGRVHGTATVHATRDGAASGVAAGMAYRLHGGEATLIDKSAAAPKRETNSIYWGQKTGTFPDGRRLVSYDLPGKNLVVEDPKGGERRRVAFDYETEGVTITSLGEGPDGVVYGSTCHPMHLLALDTKDATLTDMGPIPKVGGGNFCAIACQAIR